jgi:hypothetical protein
VAVAGIRVSVRVGPDLHRARVPGDMDSDFLGRGGGRPPLVWSCDKRPVAQSGMVR